MRGPFPRAVVLDESRNHHYAIWVKRQADEVLAMCVDCGDMARVPVAKLGLLRTLLQNDDDVQVISWIESDE